MSGFSGSHCGISGCESGWTVYFEEEEGDLSMISDASSGPTNVNYEENCQPMRQNGGKSTKSKKKEETGWRNQHSSLDDTATSPVLGLSKRETNPYTNEGFVENVKPKKQPDKKQTSFFQSSSGKKMPKNVSGNFQEEK